jgi:hypothetical protein
MGLLLAITLDPLGMRSLYLKGPGFLLGRDTLLPPLAQSGSFIPQNPPVVNLWTSLRTAILSVRL